MVVRRVPFWPGSCEPTLLECAGAYKGPSSMPYARWRVPGAVPPTRIWGRDAFYQYRTGDHREITPLCRGLRELANEQHVTKSRQEATGINTPSDAAYAGDAEEPPLQTPAYHTRVFQRTTLEHAIEHNYLVMQPMMLPQLTTTRMQRTIEWTLASRA